MTEIRYWNAEQLNNSANRLVERQANHAPASAIQDTFTQQMADILFSPYNDSMLSAFDSTDIPNEIFAEASTSNNELARLQELTNQDKKKVWAAKIANALPLSDWGSSDQKNDSSMLGGFGSIIELTVKMQMAKAKKQIEKTVSNGSMSLEEFVRNSIKDAESKEAEAAMENESRSSFIKEISDQLQNAAQQFDTTVGQLISEIGTNSEKA